MVVRALDHVSQCYSSADGAVIARALRDAFAQNQKVTLSFADVTDVPSSFVNAAIVSLLDDHTMDWLKAHLSIVSATHQTADMIKRCLANGQRLKQTA